MSKQLIIVPETLTRHCSFLCSSIKLNKHLLATRSIFDRCLYRSILPVKSCCAKLFDNTSTILTQNSSKDFCSKPINSFHRYRTIMDVPDNIFRGNVDRFNGVTVESQKEYDESTDFKEKLKKSLEFWSESKRRAIWFKILTEHADWIPHLTKNQFEFHHAKHGFVVMFRWLPTNEYVNIPAYAHTMVGVGGLVINDKNEVLVVSERYALIPNSWKLPGGYVELKEDIVDAAIREVREETGINCTFKTIVSIRHSHGGGFGCSDIYVVVGLTPKNEQLQRCEREIAKIQWMPTIEYLQHPNVHETNRQFVRTLLDYNMRNIQFTCEKGKHQILQKEYCLYFLQKIEEKSENKD